MGLPPIFLCILSYEAAELLPGLLRLDLPVERESWHLIEKIISSFV